MHYFQPAYEANEWKRKEEIRIESTRILVAVCYIIDRPFEWSHPFWKLRPPSLSLVVVLSSMVDQQIQMEPSFDFHVFSSSIGECTSTRQQPAGTVMEGRGKFSHMNYDAVGATSLHELPKPWAIHRRDVHSRTYSDVYNIKCNSRHFVPLGKYLSSVLSSKLVLGPFDRNRLSSERVQMN